MSRSSTLNKTGLHKLEMVLMLKSPAADSKVELRELYVHASENGLRG